MSSREESASASPEEASGPARKTDSGVGSLHSSSPQTSSSSPYDSNQRKSEDEDDINEKTPVIGGFRLHESEEAKGARRKIFDEKHFGYKFDKDNGDNKLGDDKLDDNNDKECKDKLERQLELYESEEEEPLLSLVNLFESLMPVGPIVEKEVGHLGQFETILKSKKINSDFPFLQMAAKSENPNMAHCQVVTNHIELTPSWRQGLYVYHIQVEPSVPMETRRSIVYSLIKQQQMDRTCNNQPLLPLYDGGNIMVTSSHLAFFCKNRCENRIPDGKQSQTFGLAWNLHSHTMRSGKFAVTQFAITISSEVLISVQAILNAASLYRVSDLNGDLALLALSTVVKEALRLKHGPKAKAVRNRIYPMDADSEHNYSSHMVVQGCVQQTLGVDSRLLCKLDVSTTAFYASERLSDFVLRSMRLSNFSCTRERHLAALNHELKGLRVETRHLRDEFGFVRPRRYTILSVIDKSAREVMIDFRANNNDRMYISVETFFHIKYGIRLRYPSLPIVQVTLGTATYFPVELCFIMGGQQCKKERIPDLETSNRICGAAVRPQERLRAINEHLQLKHERSSTLLDHFGLRMDNFLDVTATIMEPPRIMYTNTSVRVDQRTGMWDLNEARILRTANIASWLVLLDTRNATENARQEITAAEIFIQNLMRSASEMGIVLPMPMTAAKALNSDLDVASFFACVTNAQLIMVVLADGTPTIYQSIKYYGDLAHGIPTLCVQSKYVCGKAKMPRQMLGNLLQKLNLKMGGINNVVENLFGRDINDLRETIMVLGIASDKDDITITSVVASMDQYLARYRASSFVGSHQKNLTKAIRELMGHFLNENNRLPTIILVYRSVTEETLDETRVDQEIVAVGDACIDFATPAIIHISVSKNHHTRLFLPKRMEMGAESFGNVAPGTIVDVGIVESERGEFYLNAHHGNRGTNCCALYTVKMTNIDYNAKQHCLMTNEMDVKLWSWQLCFAYAKATKSVSMPAPIFYAKDALNRAKNNLQQLVNRNKSLLIIDNDNNVLGVRKEAQCTLDGHKRLLNHMSFL